MLTARFFFSKRKRTERKREREPWFTERPFCIIAMAPVDMLEGTLSDSLVLLRVFSASRQHHIGTRYINVCIWIYVSSSSSSSFFNINYRMEFRSSPNGWWCGLFTFEPNVWRWKNVLVYFIVQWNGTAKISKPKKTSSRFLNKCIVSALFFPFFSFSLHTHTHTAKWVMDSDRFPSPSHFTPRHLWSRRRLIKKTTTTWKGPKEADDNLSVLPFHWIKEKGISFIRPSVSLRSHPREAI